MSPILYQSSFRYLRRHPWQFGLAVLGVALGVTIVLSIDLTNASAQRSMELAVQSVSGRSTHQIISEGGGLPDRTYQKVKQKLGFRAAAPVLEGYVVLPEKPDQVFQLLGIDPFAEAPFRPYLQNLGGGNTGNLTAFLTEPNTVVISSDLANELSLQLGDKLKVEIGGLPQELKLVAFLKIDDPLARQVLSKLLIVDISTAQELLQQKGQLSRIDLILPNNDEEKQKQIEKLQRILPGKILVEPSVTRLESADKMTRAFRLNLSALSLLALIVGMFLIYNTMTFSVVQRYSLLGQLRAVGVTRGEIFQLILIEAIVIGVIGTLLGLIGGSQLAKILVVYVTQTINDLYYVLSVRELQWSNMSIFKGIGLGLGATLLAVIPPAKEAANIPPRMVLNRSSREESFRRTLRWSSYAGLSLGLGGVFMLLLPSRDLILSYAGLFSLIVGLALLTPHLTNLAMTFLRPILNRIFGVVGSMAARGVQAELSRTSVAIAALMVAISAAIGLGIMVGSFRHTVFYWLEQQLWADVYIVPPGNSRHLDNVLLPESIATLEQAEGVSHLTRNRRIQVKTKVGEVDILTLDLPEEGYASYVFKDATKDPWNGFDVKQFIVISEPLSNRLGLATGDKITLPTPQGAKVFEIQGIFYDYSSERGHAIIHRTHLEKFWKDPKVNSVALYLKDGWNPDRFQKIFDQLDLPQPLIIRSNVSLREVSLEIFDRTFAITGVLQLLVTGVAFVGVLSSLMALQLERQRELGILRATGMTPGQIWRLVTSQCGLMGIVAGMLAIPVGVMMAMVLIFVINQRSFGWTFPTLIEPIVLLQNMALAVFAALLAGLYPAFKMSQVPPAVVLREE
jgi:putative ABC transport system permease protein